jgi:hypothetical protein
LPPAAAPDVTDLAPAVTLLARYTGANPMSIPLLGRAIERDQETGALALRVVKPRVRREQRLLVKKRPDLVERALRVLAKITGRLAKATPAERDSAPLLIWHNGRRVMSARTDHRARAQLGNGVNRWIQRTAAGHDNVGTVTLSRLRSTLIMELASEEGPESLVRLGIHASVDTALEYLLTAETQRQCAQLVETHASFLLGPRNLGWLLDAARRGGPNLEGVEAGT